MRVAPTLAVAAALLGGAQLAGRAARDARATRVVDEPYAPTPSAAPFVALSYRELAADLLVARVMPYFGGPTNTAAGMAGLCEAILALDPKQRAMYEWCARAMTLARSGVDQRTYLRAIALLERGARELEDDWRIPYAAGQMYMLDLRSGDAAQQRAWIERGSRWLEAAVRKPGASAAAAATAATLRTRLGQHQRAIDDLREMLLITGDASARRRLLDKLAELSRSNADDLAAEIQDARRRFEAAWHRDRPAVPATMYLLLGAPLSPGFDLTDLATGGRDLIVPASDPEDAPAAESAAPATPTAPGGAEATGPADR
jgi:hypothetical protein